MDAPGRLWHVVPPGDPLTAANGSAVLTVARSLSVAARKLGLNSELVGGTGVPVDLDHARRLVVRPNDRSLATLGMRLLVGHGPGDRGAVEVAEGPPPDVMLLHNLPWLGKAARSAYPNALSVLYVHNRILNRVPRYRAAQVLKDFDGVICVSGYVADTVRRISNRSVIRTVLNGAPPPFTAPEGGATWDVGFVGRVVPEKGLHLILEGLAHAHSASRSPIRVAIAGSRWFTGPETLGPYENYVRQIARDSPLSVDFLGRVHPSDVSGFLSSCRVVAVPSVWPEPCSLVLLEALASPAAVVATRTGGTPEVATDGVRLVDPVAEDLAHALIALLEDEPARIELSERGQYRAKALSWESAMDRLLYALKAL